MVQYVLNNKKCGAKVKYQNRLMKIRDSSIHSVHSSCGAGTWKHEAIDNDR